MRHDTWLRHGASRIEVAVLGSAILAVLFLFLTALSHVSRPAAGGTQCASNLFQLSVAAIQFEDHHRFVPGWRNASPNRLDLPGTNTVSWPVVLLPFLMRNDIYRKWSIGELDAPFVSVFTCPASATKEVGPPTLSYAGNVGSGANARKWDGVMLDTTDEESGHLSFEEINAADGTSSTIFATERCGSGDRRNSRPLFQYWWDRRGLTTISPSDKCSAFFENIADYQAFGRSPRPGFGIACKPYAGMKIINNTSDNSAPGFWSQPSSNHPGGVVVVFCDGHLRFVGDSIGSAVYAQLLSSDSTRASSISSLDWGGGEIPVVEEQDLE